MYLTQHTYNSELRYSTFFLPTDDWQKFYRHITHNARGQCAASNYSESEMGTVCLETLLCGFIFFFF